MTPATKSILPDPVASQPGTGIQAPRLVPPAKGSTLWAPTYDQAPNPLLALEERELEPRLPTLAGKFVLDVACGTGRWLGKLMQKGAQAGVGLDLSLEMLARARSKPRLSGKLIQGDACALPVPSGLADVVVSSFTVGYLEDVGAFAAELFRVPRPGARVFVSDFHPSAYCRGWRRTFRSGGEVIEVSSHVRPVGRICETFIAQGCALERCLEPSLGEPERCFFEQARSAHRFEWAREGPAIFVAEFRRTQRS